MPHLTRRATLASLAAGAGLLPSGAEAETAARLTFLSCQRCL